MKNNKIMSKGLVNRLQENKVIYEICIKELQDTKKEFIKDFSYPESLEFNRTYKILRHKNIQRLKEVIVNINKSLGKCKGINSFTKKELDKIKSRRDKREEKFLEHLFNLRNLRDSQSKESVE